jgi:hypothetical protein
VALHRLGRQSFDLCLTDPPYGVGIAKRGYVGGTKRRFSPKSWDVSRPGSETLALICEVSRHQIIWGGNYFADALPPSRCWLVWHKKPYPNRTSFADCEIAWTSLDQNSKVFRHMWSGFMRGREGAPLLSPDPEASSAFLVVPGGPQDPTSVSRGSIYGLRDDPGGLHPGRNPCRWCGHGRGVLPDGR